jgi:hypothetical protein
MLLLDSPKVDRQDMQSKAWLEVCHASPIKLSGDGGASRWPRV